MSQRAEFLDLIEAAMAVKLLDSEKSYSIDRFTDRLTVTTHDGTEFDIMIREVGEAVSIDTTMAREPNRSVGSGDGETEIFEKVEVGVDPEVASAREAIDAAIPENRWSYRSNGGTYAEVISPTGDAFAVMTELIAQDLAAAINRSLLMLVHDEGTDPRA